MRLAFIRWEVNHDLNRMSWLCDIWRLRRMSFLKIYLVSKDLNVLRVPTLEILTKYKV